MTSAELRAELLNARVREREVPVTCNLFVIWGDPTKPGSAEIDETSFAYMADAEAHVMEQRRTAGETRPATIVECVESNDGGKWRRA